MLDATLTLCFARGPTSGPTSVKLPWGLSGKCVIVREIAAASARACSVLTSRRSRGCWLRRWLYDVYNFGAQAEA
jgi:hypothetical protein